MAFKRWPPAPRGPVAHIGGYGHEGRGSEVRKPQISWPAPLGDDALHRLAGDIVKTIEPHSETDPAALLVKFNIVCVEHLRAALAVWQPCEDSARFIFGAALGDPVAD